MGETLSLKTDDVNLEEGIITLYNGKNKVLRMIPMSDSLTKYLRMYNYRVDRTDGNPFFFRLVMANTILQQQFEILFEKYYNRQVFASFPTEAIHVYMI